MMIFFYLSQTTLRWMIPRGSSSIAVFENERGNDIRQEGKPGRGIYL
jgi:hypothetical protein